MDRDLYRYLKYPSKNEPETIYCPFCGEKTFKKDDKTGLVSCTSCEGINGTVDDLIEYLHSIERDRYDGISDSEQDNIDFLFDSFKYVVIVRGHYNIEESTYFTEETRVEKNGNVNIQQYLVLPDRKTRIHLKIEDGYLKNIKPLKQWIKKVLNVVSNAVDDSIEPCDAGGTIKVLKFKNLTINNLSMWTRDKEECLFFMRDMLKDNIVITSTFEGDPKTY